MSVSPTQKSLKPPPVPENAAVTWTPLFTAWNSSATASVIALIEPVTAAAIAVLLLGEHLTAATLAGTAVLLAAVGALVVAETGSRPAVRREVVGQRHVPGEVVGGDRGAVGGAHREDSAPVRE